MRRRDAILSSIALGAGLAAPGLLCAQPAYAPARFSVVVEGSGPDVILIPGFACDRTVWDGLAARLKGRFRLHLVRLKGFAGEPAGPNATGDTVVAPFVEDLAAYIAAEKLSKPAVIGHSLGGTAVLMLGARRPDLPGRLMVVDMPPFLPAAFMGPSATPESARPMADAMAQQILTSSVEAYTQQEQAYLENYTLTESARPVLLKQVLDSDRVVTAHAMHELMTTDLGPELPKITAPTTVLWAWNASLPYSEDQGDAFYAQAYAGLKGVKIIRIDDTAHFMMFDQPERFGTAVDDFLAGR